MSDGYEWYYSADEETWHLAVDKEDAIHMCLSDGYKYICEARRFDFPYSDLFDISEMDFRVMESLNDHWGEDQYSIFKVPPTNEQEAELKALLIGAFKRWADDNNIQLEEPWYFDSIRNVQEIKPENFCWVWTKYVSEVYDDESLKMFYPTLLQ
jgi:hypothetical protein